MKVVFKSDYYMYIQRKNWLAKFDNLLYDIELSSNLKIVKYLVRPFQIIMFFFAPLMEKKILIFRKGKEYNAEPFKMKTTPIELFKTEYLEIKGGENILKHNPKLIKYKGDVLFDNYILNNSCLISAIFVYSPSELRKEKLNKLNT